MLPQCRRRVCDRGHDLNVAYVTIASFAESVILDPGDRVRHFNYLRDGGG